MISYVELNPPISLTKTTTTFETFDLSASIPAGATFAITRIENLTSTGRRFGYRAVGDTAPQSASVSASLPGRMYRYFYIPMSSSRQIQIDVSDTQVNITVLAYLNENATKVNYANVAIESASVWQTVDMSAYGTPKAAIVLLNGASVGFSPYGSSANLFNSTASQAKQTFIVPLSEDYKFNVYSTTTTANVVNIIGTINRGFIKYVEPIERTPASLSVWTPLSSPSNSANAILYTMLDLGSGTDSYGFRKGGNTSNDMGRAYKIESVIMAANSAGVAEANVTNSNYKVYELGYFANVPSQITSTPTITVGEGVVLSGLELINSNTARIKTGTKTISLDSFTKTDWNISFSTPSLTSFISSNVAIGPATLEVLNTSSGIILSTPITVNPPQAEYGFHKVTSNASNTNTGSIYYNQTPAILTNDVFLYDFSTETYLWNFSITSDGYMKFDTVGATSGTDNVSYRIYNSQVEEWTTLGTITISSPYVNARSNSARVVKSADGKRYSRYSGGNAPNFLEYFNSYSDIAAAIAGDWDYADVDVGGSHAITLFQGSKRYTSTWTQNESRTLLYYRFPGAIDGDDSTGKTYVKFQWEEYRDENWTFRADKSCRMVGRLSNGNVSLDLILGLLGGGTPNQSTSAVVFGQGLGNDQQFITDSSWAMNRQQWYTIAVEVQLNTVGQSDGWIKLWRDGVLRGSATNINIRGRPIVAPNNPYTFHQVAIGGWESGGAPASSENRYIDNVEIWYS